MNKVARLRKIPEPVLHNGRQRLVGGWNTAAVCELLIEKKLSDAWLSISDIARFAYGHDTQKNRATARNNVRIIRRYLADHREFLIVRFGYRNKIESLKVCNPSEPTDREVAADQLERLVERCEIDEAERDRWAQMLYLSPPINITGFPGSPTE